MVLLKRRNWLIEMKPPVIIPSLIKNSYFDTLQNNSNEINKFRIFLIM